MDASRRSPFALHYSTLETPLPLRRVIIQDQVHKPRRCRKKCLLLAIQISLSNINISRKNVHGGVLWCYGVLSSVFYGIPTYTYLYLYLYLQRSNL